METSIPNPHDEAQVTKQARSEQTRLVLVRAAAELLHREGYAASSMTDIAHAAGITKGGLYFHFKSKDEICQAVQNDAISMLRAYAERQRRRPLSPIQRLIDLTQVLMSWMATEPVAGASLRMAREVGTTNELFLAFSREWNDLVRRGVRDAERYGALREPAPVQVTALLIAVMTLGIEMLVATKIASREADLSKSLADLWTLVLPAITSDHAHLQVRGSARR
jgi:AcrR family transcriptional regulator